MPNSPPDLRFRPFRAADAAILGPWLRDAGLLVPPGTEDGSWVQRILEDPRILVRAAYLSDASSDPVGFFRLDLAPDRVAELTLIVSPDHRRQGVGRQLLSSLLTDARQLGLRGLLAMVDEDNRVAQSFFLGKGFEDTGIHMPGFRQLSRVVHGAGSQPPLEIVL